MVDGLAVLSIRLAQSAHVLVSLAHVVVMVAQVSANETLAEFVSVVVGFAVFVMLILCRDMPLAYAYLRQFLSLRSIASFSPLPFGALPRAPGGSEAPR